MKETFNEKRKWQIALRRYVIDRQISQAYAPYFGLDIENIRQWFQSQFTNQMNWDNFGTAWQFEHIVPVANFDFNSEQELKLCWNFTNLKPTSKQDKSLSFQFSYAKAYFQTIYFNTGYFICGDMLHKLEMLSQQNIDANAQSDFIKNRMALIEKIHSFSSEELELLNRGRKIEEIEAEQSLLNKFGN